MKQSLLRRIHVRFLALKWFCVAKKRTANTKFEEEAVPAWALAWPFYPGRWWVMGPNWGSTGMVP